MRATTFLLVLIATMRTAFADSTDEARKHYERASAAYALGRFAEAALEFEKAFDLKPEAALLYNAAQAHRIARNNQRALLLYQSYLRVFGDSITNGDEAKRHIEDLRKIIESEQQPAPSARPATPAALTPPASSATATKPANSGKPLVRKAWFWVSIVAAAAVVATGVGLGVAYGSRTVDPVPSQGMARGD